MTVVFTHEANADAGVKCKLPATGGTGVEVTLRKPWLGGLLALAVVVYV